MRRVYKGFLFACVVAAVAAPAGAQGSAPLLGPGPRLTNAQALSDLRAAKIVPPQITASSEKAIAAQTFIALLARTLAVEPRVAAGAFPAGIVNSTGPVVREDAVAGAMSVAAAKGALRAGTRPAVYPRFDDDAAFASAGARALAHEAVYANLVQIGPDNRFRPREALTYGDAAYLLDAIRLSSLSPESE